MSTTRNRKEEDVHSGERPRSAILPALIALFTLLGFVALASSTRAGHTQVRSRPVAAEVIVLPDPPHPPQAPAVLPGAPHPPRGPAAPSHTLILNLSLTSYGLTALPAGGPLRLSREQARRFLEIFALMRDEDRGESYAHEELQRCLTAAQRDFLAHNRRNTKPWTMRSPAYKKELMKRLAAASAGRRAARLEIPADWRGNSGSSIDALMPEFIMNYDALEEHEDLRLTPDQAARIAALLELYLRVIEIDEQELFLQALTKAQRKYLYEQVRFPPDLTRADADRFLALLEARARGLVAAKN